MMLIASAPVAGMAQGQAGIRAENLDKSVRPADDFFTFATGGWQKRNPDRPAQEAGRNRKRREKAG